MLKRILIFCTFVSIVIIAGLGVIHRQFVRDTYIVMTTDVQPQAAELQSNIELTNDGDFIYEASQPEVLDNEPFNRACGGAAEEHSLVLGCYTAQRFYIYDVEDERLAGVKEVTAAHELLHAVYERLTQNEKTALNEQLVRTADSISDEQFKQTVEAYRKADSSQVANELHSILGTEVAVLPAALERHYAQYFADRQKIVSFSNQYQELFRESERQREVYEAQRSSLKVKIDETNQEIDQLQNTLDARQAELSNLRRSDIRAYNNAVPSFNALVAQYNALISDVKQYIAQYNDLTAKQNALAVTQNELQQLLDSNYQAR